MNGSCLCGKLRYEIDDTSGLKSLCHCLQCRKITGSAFSTCMLVPEKSFRIVAGNPRHYTFVQESGLKFTTSFCEECAGVIGKTQAGGEEFKGLFVLFMGTLDQDISTVAAPAVEIWSKHRVSWLKPLPEVSQAEAFPSL